MAAMLSTCYCRSWGNLREKWTTGCRIEPHRVGLYESVGELEHNDRTTFVLADEHLQYEFDPVMMDLYAPHNGKPVQTSQHLNSLPMRSHDYLGPL